MSNKELKTTPSLQHTVCLIGANPAITANNILKLRNSNPPRTFEARDWVIKLLSRKMSYEVLMGQAKCLKGGPLKDAVLEILPLVADYMRDHDVKWFRPIEEMHFELLPGVVIPLSPLGVGMVDGEMVSIWPQTWKRKSLLAHQFNLWATIYTEKLAQVLPEVEKFHWLEMSVPKSKKVRELRVRTNEAARFLSINELNVVREHLLIAMQIVEEAPRKPKRPRKPDPRQTKLWPDE